MDLGTEILIERGRLRGQAREDEAAEGRGPELARAVVGLAEGLRHATEAANALLEGDAEQIATQVVAPRVIDALEVLGGAAVVERDQRSPVRAPVLEGVDLAVLAADDDDRHLAHEGGPVGAGPLEVRLETDVAPRGALEDSVHLRPVIVRVLVDPVGDAGQRGAGPRVLRVGSGHARPPAGGRAGMRRPPRRIRFRRRSRPRCESWWPRRDDPRDGTARCRSAACRAAGP